MKEELDNYLLGNLSDKEKAALLDKIELDADCKSEFIRMQNTVALSKLYEQKGDKEWAGRMINELERKAKRKQNRRLFLNIARYAAVIVLLVINGWLFGDKISLAKEEAAYTVVEVPKGQRICMMLTDGTEVWLSPRSVLHIPERFGKNERLVKLDGEGYFSVTKNDKKPFVVQTERHNIKVLGTRFNVFAYSESERFETDLLEGKVEISDREKQEKSIILTPGEKASLKSNQLVKSISVFNNEEYLKNGIFNFNNKPFGEIMEYLTLWYDVRFDIKDSAKKELLVSGKFRQSDEIKIILKALQGVHAFKFKEINEQRIEIY
ncbi:MAG: FecR family protein [Dysgonamonadaceae bacterium]|jgi:ferric-dicitrate binding protein FerR (iron transport regulator)|nr:FecR family protein [Dysgonamonadaceae bacterium]